MPKGKKDAFIKEGEFKCECGREFTKSQSLYAHYSHCKIHLGRDPKDRFGDSRAWSRGLTKETNNVLKSRGVKQSIKLKELGDQNPLVVYNRNKPKEAYDRQSKTRKKKYASGELVPAFDVGKGVYSYLIYGVIRRFS